MKARKKQITGRNQCFIPLIESAISDNWELDALTDYEGKTLKYKDVALQIRRLHMIYAGAGVRRGEKIALCGRNSSDWGVVFLSILTYGAVAVPILHDFKADNVQNIVRHSDAKLLFVCSRVWENLDENEMPDLCGILSMDGEKLIVCRYGKLEKVFQNAANYARLTQPDALKADGVSYHCDKSEQPAYISYTSGTTSFSKGVVIPYRSLWSNVRFAMDNMPIKPGDNHVCMLPMAHGFGLLFDFLFEFCKGCHTYFLTRTPSPKIIFRAYQEMKPTLIITVPLLIEKIIKRKVFPELQKPQMKVLLKLPIARRFIYRKIRNTLCALFGNNFIEIIIGGAGFNEDVERLLRQIKFPYTVGYGMTECGPLISYAPAASFKEKSCGRPVDRIEVRIDSEDPEHTAGEIIVKGMNVMLKYYKNPDDTRKVLDKRGWLRTGDMATMDAQGNITIRGRCKTMLLGSNGQNIYPEEIEELLNNMPYVAESLIVEKDKRLVALIHPDFNEALADGLKGNAIEKKMEENRKRLNRMLPKYSQIASVKIFSEEFEKTPKRSIKRYLYQ